MQEGGRSLIFGFFPTPSQLIKTPTFINLSKRCQKSNFISMHKEQKTVFISCFAYIGGCLKRCALYSRFEACSVKKRIIQRSGKGNQLTENDNHEEAEEVEECNQNMTKKDYLNLFENLFD